MTTNEPDLSIEFTGDDCFVVFEGAREGVDSRAANSRSSRHPLRPVIANFCNKIGQKRTHAPQQPAVSFDYFVGARSVAVVVRSSSIRRLWRWRLRQRSAASSPWARAAAPRKKQGMN